MIRVWKFKDAPVEYRALSRNGGDEDWVVEVPNGYLGYCYPIWLEAIDACREPYEFILDHATIYIGSHS